MAKDCPKCGLLNPPNAQRCDCGYDFDTGFGQNSRISIVAIARLLAIRLRGWWKERPFRSLARLSEKVVRVGAEISGEELDTTIQRCITRMSEISTYRTVTAYRQIPNDTDAAVWVAEVVRPNRLHVQQ